MFCSFDRPTRVYAGPLGDKTEDIKEIDSTRWSTEANDADETAERSLPPDESSRTRPIVMCGENGFSSPANPARESSDVTDSAHRCRVPSAAEAPAQTIRTGPRGGKQPHPSTFISNGSNGAAPFSIASQTAGTCESGTSPRNFTVKCSSSGRIQRTPGQVRPNTLCKSARFFRTRSLNTMATNNRMAYPSIPTLYHCSVTAHPSCGTV